MSVGTLGGASANIYTLFVLAGCSLCCYVGLYQTSSKNEDHLTTTTPLAVQVLGLVVSVASVSVPGRFDSDIDPKAGFGFPWPTLFSPAGFAFAVSDE